MKAFRTESLETLSMGSPVVVESYGAGKDGKIVATSRERGILVGAWSKLREIKVNGELTGKFELVKDRVIYEVPDEKRVTVIGGGLFEVYGYF